MDTVNSQYQPQSQVPVQPPVQSSAPPQPPQFQTQTQPQPQPPMHQIPNTEHFTTSSPGFSTGIPPQAKTPTTVFAPQHEKKGIKAKNIALIAIMVLVLAGLVLGFGKARSFLSKAEGDCSPEGLREISLTATSVEVSYTTSKACQTEIAYGVSAQSMLLQVPESMASLNHRVRLSPLLTTKTYNYQVVIGGAKTGTVRSFLTLANQPTSVPVLSNPTAVPTQAAASSSGSLTLSDFETQFGLANPTYDIDKNGIVNVRDWLLYQKTQ